MYEALCRPSEYSIKLRKHYVARQSALSNCGSIMSAVRVLYQIAASTMSAVRVLYQIAQALCRPSECSIKLRKHYVGRQSAISNRASIMSAVRVLYFLQYYYFF